ncbi:hypothetical protein [Georgenia sp. MJ170]|uniref:hypothetical protein n=1 Tax=Georgenia sunbinii TaxID=3117728 RepID=UPI002F26A2DF
MIELDQGLMAEAARLAKVYDLRGYEATHCAAAVAVDDPELLASSGDGRLLAAWRSEGLAVRDTNA